MPMVYCDCVICKKEFTRDFRISRGEPPKYCSKECMRIGFRGTGNPRYGRNSWNKGVPCSPETVKKIRASLIGDKAPRWNGGKIHNSKGYIQIKSHEHPYKDKRGYILEHRLVMEKKIGRYLTRIEVVHHINGNPSDNRIENLQLFSCSAEHIRFHSKQDPFFSHPKKLPQ